MKKLTTLLLLFCVHVFAGVSPVQMNPWTTNLAANLPTPQSLTNLANGNGSALTNLNAANNGLASTNYVNAATAGMVTNEASPTFASVTISGPTKIASAHGATAPAVFKMTGTTIADGTYLYNTNSGVWLATNGPGLTNTIQVFAADLGWIIWSPTLRCVIKGAWGEDGYYQPLTDADLLWSDSGGWVMNSGTIPPVFTVTPDSPVATLFDLSQLSSQGTLSNSDILFSGSIYHNTNLIFSFNDTNGAILIGPLAKFSGQLGVDIRESPVAIGYNTAVTGFGVAIGAGAVSAGSQGVALGAGSQSTGNRGIAIGWDSVAAGGQDIAIGDEVNALGGQGVGIGFANQVGANSTAVGAYTTASGNSSQALGYNLYVTGSHSTGLGGSFTLARDYAFAWSDNNTCPATTNNQVAFYASNGYLFAGGPIAGNGSGLTNLQSSNIVTTTDAAPTGITWGVTVPDYWIKLTNSSTVGYVWMPCWTNH